MQKGAGLALSANGCHPKLRLQNGRGRAVGRSERPKARNKEQPSRRHSRRRSLRSRKKDLMNNQKRHMRSHHKGSMSTLVFPMVSFTWLPEKVQGLIMELGYGEKLSVATGTGIRESPKREEIIPSNILEKGIIYFFFRPRVNVAAPHSINDIARSFSVLRPTPRSAQLERGLVGSDGNCRLLILPKKKFPTSSRERDMGFVEKAGVSVKTLQETVLLGVSYQTQTRGERTRFEARPYAEGVYAIVSTSRTSHLVYIITIPSDIGNIQQDFGLHSRGSFILRSKNPKYPGPPFAQLPKSPEYPEQ
jgi:hypothetical protein